MRVIIFSDVSRHMRGGVPAVTAQLIRGLLSRGHEVALAGDGLVPGGEGARLYPISVPTDARLAQQVGAALKAFAPDFVHVMAMSAPGTARVAPVLRPYAWAFDCHSAPPYERIVGAMHGWEPVHYAARALRFAPNTLSWRWLLGRGVMPHVITHSAFVRDVVTRYGCAEANTTLIPLAIEPGTGAALPSRPPELDAGPRLVTVGGIAHTKGQHDAIDAVARLVPEWPGIRYQIIGEVRDRSYLGFLQWTIRRLGLADRVSIAVNASTEEKQRALREADVYLQPSHEEGFCLAFLEAALVVPRVIGTDTGAIGQVCEGNDGARLVPPRRPAALAEAIGGLLRAELPPQAMAHRAARLTAQFSLDRYLDAHEALYARLQRR